MDKLWPSGTSASCPTSLVEPNVMLLNSGKVLLRSGKLSVAWALAFCFTTENAYNESEILIQLTSTVTKTPCNAETSNHCSTRGHRSKLHIHDFTALDQLCPILSRREQNCTQSRHRACFDHAPASMDEPSTYISAPSQKSSIFPVCINISL